jgi:hypothetical protein
VSRQASAEPTTLEWVTIRRRPDRSLGAVTDVTVTRRRENVTARWVVRTQSSHVTAAVGEARNGAERALVQALEAIA